MSREEPPGPCYGIYRQATINGLLDYMSWRFTGLQRQVRNKNGNQ